MYAKVICPNYLVEVNGKYVMNFSSQEWHKIFICGLDFQPGMMVGKSLEMPIFLLIYHDQQGVGNDVALNYYRLKSRNTNSVQIFFLIFH